MKKKAFGLLETSILLVIIAIMTMSALSLYNINYRKQSSIIKNLTKKHNITNIEQLDTRDRIDKIYDSIKLFVIHNHRLPCPDENNDGTEANNEGNCDNSSVITNSDIKYGTLPYKTLNLTKEFSLDQWNDSFTYYIDKKFTKRTKINDIDGFAATKTMYNINNDADSNRVIDSNFEIININDGTNIISPKDGLDNTIRPDASYIFAIISGKSDGFNLENDDDDNLFKITDNNDDIIFAKNKQEILQDSNMEYFLCSKNDGKITFNDDIGDNDGNLGSCASTNEIEFPNIIYNVDIFGIVDCPCDITQKIVRKCEKYGIWQNIELMIQNQCNQ